MSIEMSLSKLHKIVKDREAWHAPVLGSHKDWTDWLNNNNNNNKALLMEWVSISIYVWNNAAEFIGNKVNQ